MSNLTGYARVSSVEQNPELQLDALRKAGCERIFTDQASGALAERPELRRVLDHLRAGDTLVVWKLDRLGRSLRHLIDTVRSLEEQGVGLRSLHESLDNTTSGGRLVFHVFGALAEFERELIAERTHAGLAAARARGRKGGRPSVMTEEKISLAKQMYDSRNHTVAAIAATHPPSSRARLAWPPPKPPPTTIQKPIRKLSPETGEFHPRFVRGWYRQLTWPRCPWSR